MEFADLMIENCPTVKSSAVPNLPRFGMKNENIHGSKMTETPATKKMECNHFTSLFFTNMKRKYMTSVGIKRIAEFNFTRIDDAKKIPPKNNQAKIFSFQIN
jgi:hypothetical protein